MQLSLPLDRRPARLAAIHRRLGRRIGRPGPFRLLDPISQLVMGLVGGRTHGHVSLAAFEALARRFPHWEDMLDAPVAEIERAISEVTYAEIKAPRLKASLNAVMASEGRLALDRLDPMPVDPALAWLERLPGVGRKTSAATLNFSTLRKRALVIDTHHLRVLRRLGFVGRRATIVEAYDRLTPLLPDVWTAVDFDDHHQHMKTIGQTCCRPARPTCGTCPLRDVCPSAQTGRPPLSGRADRRRRHGADPSAASVA